MSLDIWSVCSQDIFASLPHTYVFYSLGKWTSTARTRSQCVWYHQHWVHGTSPRIEGSIVVSWACSHALYLAQADLQCILAVRTYQHQQQIQPPKVLQTLKAWIWSSKVFQWHEGHLLSCDSPAVKTRNDANMLYDLMHPLKSRVRFNFSSFFWPDLTNMIN